MTKPARQLSSQMSTILEEVVGYLNFSSGTSDAKFLRNINLLYAELEDGQPSADTHQQLSEMLLETISRLQRNGKAFENIEQAETVVQLLSGQLLHAYREFHIDLLFHQSDAGLWRPFFVGRALEALVSQGGPWEEHDRIVQGAIAQMNDYVGYRPVATLTSGNQSMPYAHEFVRPIPLFIRGAGVAVGRYEKIISLALDILANTDEDLLNRAWFDLERLEEVALDPREYDFDHPANRRPNYHFGQWDPNRISNSGYYTRMVLQQVTLDALLSRCKDEDCSEETRENHIHEAAAVLAGTILMASGTSGDGPGRHDSTVTLSTLLPHIASYRDDFYEQLLLNTEGSLGEHLREEAKRFRQPFGAARQHLNHELARRRAKQMQHVHLSHLFARLGYPHAAQREAELVRVPAARMLSEIYGRLTGGHDAIDDGQLDQVVQHLTECESLVLRAIECGALVDPWNVVGFAGNFSLFPALENSVHDFRVDELVDLVEQVLDLAARAWSESAARDNSVLEQQFSAILSRMAAWWDQFATTTVEGIQRLVAKEIEVSANLVAGSLNAWHKAGAAAGDIGFWRLFVEQFDSSKAFQLVIEALLDHRDTVASMALMMQWVSQKDRTPLEEGDASFRRLAFSWLATVEQQQGEQNEDSWPQVAKFFAYLEANAEEFWEVPSLMLDSSLGSLFDEVIDDIEDAEFFEDQEDDSEVMEEEDEDEGLFEAAYEEMVFRDSSDDGREGDLADDEIAAYEDTEWELEVERLHQRLRFLTTVARLWKHATITWGSVNDSNAEKTEIFDQWLNQCSTNYRQLVELLETVHGYRLMEPSGSHESLVEFDRMRTIKEGLIQKILTTCVETSDSARLLAAVQGERAGAAADAFGEPLNRSSVLILQAVLDGDVESVRSTWPDFVKSIQPRSLLYLPHSRGGKPRQIVATRGLQQLLHDLLGWLPGLGMIRETCQLLELAQEMEHADMQREHPIGPGAVTEFDRLFANGYQAIVRSIVASSETWKPSDDRSGFTHKEHLLVDALQQLTERQLNHWLQHSRTLRLSVVERLSDDTSWKSFVEFIKRYGGDIFDQRFMSFGNLRGILHQSVDMWLDSMADNPDAAEDIRLLEDLEEGHPRDQVVDKLTTTIEAVVENYQIYRDYNTTTTQSDHGELLYTLIDFLRLKAAYDRVAWNLRPVVWAHEILVRQQKSLASEMWCQAFAERTAEAADAHLKQLAALSQQYGMQLPTIADRIGERFVRPLLIDRVKALIEPALTATGDDRKEAFLALDREIESLAIEPSGAGLVLPDWLAALEDEVTAARTRSSRLPSRDRLGGRIGQVLLSWDELLAQLEEPGGDEA